MDECKLSLTLSALSCDRDTAMRLIHSWHASASSNWTLVSPSKMSSQISGSLTLFEDMQRGSGPVVQQKSEECQSYTDLQESDCVFLEWVESGLGRAHIGSELKSMRSRAAAQMISQVGAVMFSECCSPWLLICDIMPETGNSLLPQCS